MSSELEAADHETVRLCTECKGTGAIWDRGGNQLYGTKQRPSCQGSGSL